MRLIVITPALAQTATPPAAAAEYTQHLRDMEVIREMRPPDALLIMRAAPLICADPSLPST